MIGRIRREIERQMAADDEFDRLVDRLAEHENDLRADGNRGRPEVDLSGWAARRGLQTRGDAPQAGYLNITCPWSVDLLFNVVRGPLPGGEHGVVCHENRVQFYDESGRFFGGRILGRPATVGTAIGTALDVVGVGLPLGSAGVMTVPYTAAGVRVAHLGAFTGLHVARRSERFTKDDSLMGTWAKRPLDDLGLPGWMAAVRKHSDEAVTERLLSGPIAQRLRGGVGLGFEIMVQFGQVRVAQQTYLKRDEALDELAGIASWVAGAVREACAAPPVAAIALGRQLAAPAWLAPVRARMREAHTLWPIGARLERVVAIADERGLAVEDPRSFHRTFAGLNLPGEAFAVLRGRLPGTPLHGRLLCCADRVMSIPQEFERVLTDPGGRAGCDVAVVALAGDVVPTAVEGELEDGLRVAIADGVLTTWRTRQSWQADGAALDRLAVDTAMAMARRGLVAAWKVS